MKSLWCCATLLFVSILLITLCLQEVHGKRRDDDEKHALDMQQDSHIRFAGKRSQHEYKKYSREFSEESVKPKAKQSKGRSKKLVLDLDNVNEDELTSDERAVLEYRRKKLERQNKKTLGKAIEEKKQKNKQRKEKFEKHVLKHFRNDKDKDDDEAVSSEEVITPLKRATVKVADVDDCNSSEEKCS